MGLSLSLSLSLSLFSGVSECAHKPSRAHALVCVLTAGLGSVQLACVRGCGVGARPGGAPCITTVSLCQAQAYENGQSTHTHTHTHTHGGGEGRGGVHRGPGWSLVGHQSALASTLCYAAPTRHDNITVLCQLEWPTRRVLYYCTVSTHAVLSPETRNWPLSVLRFWDKNTGICDGAMP